MSFCLTNTVQFVNCIVFNIFICLIWVCSFLSLLGSLSAQPLMKNDTATDVKGKKLKNKRELEENEKLSKDESESRTYKRLKSGQEKDILNPECTEGSNLDFVGSSQNLSAIAPETNLNVSHSRIKDDSCKDVKEVEDSDLIIDDSVNNNDVEEATDKRPSYEANKNVLVQNVIAELIDAVPEMQKHTIFDNIMDCQQIQKQKSKSRKEGLNLDYIVLGSPLDLSITPETNLGVTPSCSKNVVCKDLKENDPGLAVSVDDAVNHAAVEEATMNITSNEAHNDVVQDIIDDLIDTVPTMQKIQNYKIIDKIVDRQQIPKQKPKSGKFWKEGRRNQRAIKRRSVSFEKRMKNKEQKLKNKKLSDLLLRNKELLEAEVREKSTKGKIQYRENYD